MEIPAGFIKPHVPRPLTDEERAVLRARVGGDADLQSLKKLAKRKSTVVHQKHTKTKAAKPRPVTQWSKDDDNQP